MRNKSQINKFSGGIAMHTIEETMSALGMSRDNVLRLQASAFEKLRRHTLINELKASIFGSTDLRSSWPQPEELT